VDYSALSVGDAVGNSCGTWSGAKLLFPHDTVPAYLCIETHDGSSPLLCGSHRPETAHGHHGVLISVTAKNDRCLKVVSGCHSAANLRVPQVLEEIVLGCFTTVHWLLEHAVFVDKLFYDCEWRRVERGRKLFLE
jgi:hypothetical protein